MMFVETLRCQQLALLDPAGRERIILSGAKSHGRIEIRDRYGDTRLHLQADAAGAVDAADQDEPGAWIHFEDHRGGNGRRCMHRSHDLRVWHLHA